jgi:F-type H+-transporting ATPase subunit a
MFFSLAEVEVGTHLIWNFAGLSVHGQVLLVTWLVIAIILGISILGTQNMQQAPSGLQNFVEAVFEYVAGIAKDQLGEHEYRPWVPYVGTLFLFIFVANWLGALVPWKLIKLPEGELAAPTNDINTTVALSLLTSISYFYGGFKAKGLGFFARYISPTPIFLPINILASQCCVARVQPSSGGAFPCCAGQHQLCGSQKPVVDQPCVLLLLRLRMSPWFPVRSFCQR